VPDQPEGPADPLQRMDAFARRVGFTPTRLPAVLHQEETGDQRPDVPRFVFDWSKLLPSLTLNLHFAAENLTGSNTGDADSNTDGQPGGVVRWEGEGPVTHQFVHDHLRPIHAYRIQPVIDLAGQAPVDAYEIPDRHRRAVRLRTPADCFPYAGATARGDVDHTRPYQHAPEPRAAGERESPEQALQSRLDNYGPLGRFHHRIKTHGAWTVRQPFDGIYLWRDPHGQLYLVDHTGTHKLTPPGHRVAPGPERILEVDFGPRTG